MGNGESEAISLSLELNADLLIIDDLAARKVAQELEIKITGVVGIRLTAKKLALYQRLKAYWMKCSNTALESPSRYILEH